MRYSLENTREAILAPNAGTTTLRPTIGRGPAGQDGSNVLPTDEAIGNALEGRGLPTSGTDLATAVDARAVTRVMIDAPYTEMLTSPEDSDTGGLSIQDNPDNPRTDPGKSLLLLLDYLGAPIFSVPVAGGPKTFGDNMGVWTSVWERAISTTPWGSIQVGNGAAQKQLWFCRNAPLDAETVGQITTMAVPGHDPYPKVGDLCLSMLDERTLWRCTVAGTAGDRDGQWLPITVGSSIKAVTNASVTGPIPTSAELVFAFNAITLTLPNPSGLIHGRQITVKNGGASTITIAAHAGSIIDGAASISLAAGQAAHLVSLTSLWARV